MLDSNTLCLTLTLCAATRLLPPSRSMDAGSRNQPPGIAGEKRTLTDVVYPKHKHGEALEPEPSPRVRRCSILECLPQVVNESAFK